VKWQDHEDVDSTGYWIVGYEENDGGYELLSSRQATYPFESTPERTVELKTTTKAGASASVRTTRNTLAVRNS